MRQAIIELAVMLAIAIVLALLGPFGSYGLGGFAERLAYWLPAALIGYTIFKPGLWLAERAAEALDLPRWGGLLVALVVGALPATLAIRWLNGHSLLEPFGIERFAALYANVLVVGMVVLAIFLLLERGAQTSSAATDAPDAPDAPSPFLQRLSPHLPPLAALEMEDHYVRAHGRDGRSELVLMRMRDAVAELGPTDGIRVHRSWWVARDAVTGQRRDGRRLVLLLANGLEAPVARDRVADVRAAGWL